MSAGTGDNMAAALGLGARPGDVVVSLGTSGTVFAVSERPSADPAGEVAGFADATGRFLPLVCTLNAARVLDAAARLLGVEPRGAVAAGPVRAARRGRPHAGARTWRASAPRTARTRPGSLHGLRLDNSTPAHLARAAVEGMLCGLADGLDALHRPRRRAPSGSC